MTKDELLEIIREEIENLFNEDEYDRWRDAQLDRNPTWGSNRRGSRTPVVRYTAKDALLAQTIKYKNKDGSEGEGTIKSLLGYDKDHPGRKAAALAYAKFKKGENTISEHSAELDERTVASREPPRKMDKGQVKKRDTIGKKLLKNKRSVRYFKDKFGDDWKSYLWAASTNKSLAGKKSKKGKK